MEYQYKSIPERLEESLMLLPETSSFENEYLFDVPEFKDDDADVANLQPTPINPDRLISVGSVPLHATKWDLDDLCFESLKKLTSDKKKGSMTPDSSTSTSLNIKRIDCALSIVSANSELDDSDTNTFYQSQIDLWNLRYKELVEFQREHKHCFVPLKNFKNPSLSHWVKRQRYQYRMKKNGKRSTLDAEREAALDKLGFVWDSHSATWEERWNELREFRDLHGHANVPKTYKAKPQLAIWVKGQRRQFKLFIQNDKRSAMTMERIEKLLHLGFVFSPRPRPRR